MSKTLKIGIIVGLLILIMFLINKLLMPPVSIQIKNYLLSDGYQEEKLDSTLLYKSISSNIVNRFSIADYTLNQNIEELNDGIASSLNQTYDFKDHNLEYNYHIDYGDNVNVIFKGTYFNDDFFCEKEFSTVSLSSDDINNTCSLIKIKVQRFYSEANVLFANYSFIKYMESVKIE